MIKIIFIDLDGTLLTDKKEITHYSISIIKKAIKKGVKIILTTARPPRDSRTFYEKLELNTPIINYNGGLIHHYQTGYKYANYTINRKTFSKMYPLIYKAQNFLVEVDDGFFVKTIDEQVASWINSGSRNPLAVGDILDIVPSEISKIMVRGNTEIQDEIAKLLNCNIIPTTSDPNTEWVEWLHPKANKANAMLYISKILGVKNSNIMAVGDELNDLEMIRKAGVGVAMGNSNLKVKEVANFITKSNLENGVAEAIEKFVL